MGGEEKAYWAKKKHNALVKSKDEPRGPPVGPIDPKKQIIYLPIPFTLQIKKYSRQLYS